MGLESSFDNIKALKQTSESATIWKDYRELGGKFYWVNIQVGINGTQVSDLGEGEGLDFGLRLPGGKCKGAFEA